MQFDTIKELKRRGVDVWEMEVFHPLGEDVAETGHVVQVHDLQPLLVRLQSLEQALEESRIDAVTGLPVRSVLDRAYRRSHDRARRTGAGPLAVVLFDVDRFKAINDQHGHAVGDFALQFVAEQIRGTARASDFVGRYGGDEIVVVMEYAGEEDARRFAERAVRAVRTHPGPVEGLTASAGYAVLCGDEPADVLLAQADRALYAAKAAGRDRASGWCHPAGADTKEG